ncbi:MAG: MBL fold metallo-hydrolase [Sporichthyaceae bacterium]|nr:MBL fold metallo-hydrolase [Sporichthyaceae bacterium]
MARPPALELVPGVYRIPTAPADLINSYLFKDQDGQLTLVDAGLRTAPKRVVAALRWLGYNPADVTRIVLTHAHPDHAGGLAKLAAQTAATVTAHERDASYLRAGKAPARDVTLTTGRLFNRFGSGRFSATEVGAELVDGQLLDVGGGVEVIHTPGHTPGHVALLHRGSGVLITGDAIFNVRGMRWSPKALCTDFALTRSTANRLGELDYTIAAFTHGPEIRYKAREEIRAFLRRQGVHT